MQRGRMLRGAWSGTRYLYVRERAIEFCVAAGALVSAVVFAFTPGSFEATSIGANVPAWLAGVWVAGYVAGGFGVCAGRLLPSLNLERAGLTALAGAFSANAVSILIARGGQGIATTCLLLACAIGMVLRAGQIASTGR